MTDRAPARVRVDSWLWAVRIYRTRSLAADACRAGHVRIGGTRVKPAALVAIGTEVRALTAERERILVVTALVTKRIGAAAAAECYVDNSPPVVRSEAEQQPVQRDRGAGRPTKRQRREIDRLRGR
jgi:ribosome-associated heat shock protein Hsp15